MPDDLGIWLTMRNGQRRRFLKSSIWSYMAYEGSAPAAGLDEVEMNSFVCASGPMPIDVAETVEELRSLLGW